MTARLCILTVAVALIARTRVTLLPGWQAPLPAVLVTVMAIGCAGLAAWLVWRERRRTRAPRHARTYPVRVRRWAP